MMGRRVGAYLVDVVLYFVALVVLFAAFSDQVSFDEAASRPDCEVVVEEFVHTNTSGFGDKFSITNHCLGWTSGSEQLEARRGFNALQVEEGPDWEGWRDQRWWTSFANQKCYALAHLYCIDDGEIVDAQD